VLFDLFNPRVIPHFGIDKNNPKKDYSHVSPILASHSEVERSEYNYSWNSDCLRSIEFSTKPEIVVLGCSVTLGQGLPEHLRWSNILSDNIKMPVGNISYSGASANLLVSSFFGMIHQYQYKPKVVLAHFANFERFYFISQDASAMHMWYINHKEKKTKATAPWDYEEILPYEWVYYQNLDHIKMLEAFCESNNIKLIWTTWSNTLTTEQEDFLKDNFRHYVSDTTKKEFPTNFETGVQANDVSELKSQYEIINWNGCHEHYQKAYTEIFDYGYDYHKIPYNYGRLKGPGAHWPHPGVHKQLHIAEFWEKQMNSIQEVGQ